MMHMHDMKTRSCTMPESETTSEWNWKVIRHGEAGRRGARSLKVTFTLKVKRVLSRTSFDENPFSLNIYLFPILFTTVLTYLGTWKDHSLQQKTITIICYFTKFCHGISTVTPKFSTQFIWGDIGDFFHM